MAQAVDRRKTEKKEELVEKLVHINRVAKTVKGGRNMSFAAVVVVGDQKGRVGYGSGKAAEVPEAITKATNEAKKNMVRIPLREGRTLHHDVQGHFGAGKVVLRTAPAGLCSIRPPKVPALSPAARCAQSLKFWVFRTWLPSRSAPTTRTT